MRRPAAADAGFAATGFLIFAASGLPPFFGAVDVWNALSVNKIAVAVATNRPPGEWRGPRTSTVAPLAGASAMWVSTFARAAWSMSGPGDAPASRPGAGFSFFTASASFDAKAP